MKSRMECKMSSPVVIGVDIGKDVFHLVGFAADGKQLGQKWKRISKPLSAIRP